jgi:hypothetical protein
MDECDGDMEDAGRLFDEMPEGTTMPLCQAGGGPGTRKMQRLLFHKLIPGLFSCH